MVPQEPASTTTTATTSVVEVTTLTGYTTTTVTETVTTVLPAETLVIYFPQYQSKNMSTRAGTKKFGSLYSDAAHARSTTTTPELCCQSCALDPACGGWSHGGNQCVYTSAGTNCGASPPPLVEKAGVMNYDFNANTVGDANCGKVLVTTG
jgi:hypothetical protein